MAPDSVLHPVIIVRLLLLLCSINGMPQRRQRFGETISCDGWATCDARIASARITVDHTFRSLYALRCLVTHTHACRTVVRYLHLPRLVSAYYCLCPTIFFFRYTRVCILYLPVK